MVRMNGKLIDVATCDWKSPGDLIAHLVDRLPKFGVHAVAVDTGGDGFAMAFSDSPITEAEAGEAVKGNGLKDWDLDKDEPLSEGHT